MTYAYDGFLLTGTTWNGTVAGTVSQSYDGDFRVIAQEVNGASPVAFGYDLDGLLTQAGDLALTYDVQTALLATTGLGGVTDGRTYNAFGELTDHQTALAGTGTYRNRYTRDPLGRITDKQETVQGLTHTFEYEYDTAGRLTDVREDGVLVSHYEYDLNGNRTSATVQGITSTGSYDDQDRLLTYGGNAYTYTANGELLTKTEPTGTSTYDYDELGNLVGVSLPDLTTIEYVVDGLNRRIGKKVNGTLVQGFLYESQLAPVAELDGAGNVVSRFVYATRVNVPDYMIRGGQTYRIVTDHLGSPRLVVNTTTGHIVQEMAYDEFGRVLADSNPGFQPFGFAGGIYDPHTKLTRFGARDYDALTGRWTTKDPVGFSTGDPNLYSYVLQDPVNLVDIVGLLPREGKLWIPGVGSVDFSIVWPNTKGIMFGTLDGNLPANFPPIGDLSRDETLNVLADAFTDELGILEGSALQDALDALTICPTKDHKRREKLARKAQGILIKVRERIQKNNPKWPWQQWQPYFRSLEEQFGQP